MKREITRKERDCLVMMAEHSDNSFPIRLCEIAKLMNIKAPTAYELISRLENKGLVTSRNGMIILTGEGKKECENILLNHRVFESLFVKSGISMERACEETSIFDYSLDPKMAMAVLRMIGNPQLCPHGKPIRAQR